MLIHPTKVKYRLALIVICVFPFLSGVAQITVPSFPKDTNFVNSIGIGPSYGRMLQRNADFIGASLGYSRKINDQWVWTGSLAYDQETPYSGDTKIINTYTAIGTISYFLDKHWGLTTGLAKGESPLLNVAILKNKTFTIGMIVQGLLYFLVAAVLFSVSVFVMSAAGFDSLQTGLATLPASLGVAVFAMFTPSLGTKIPPKIIILTGFVLVGLGIYFLGADTSVVMTPWTILKGTILFGIGGGLVMGQIATVTMLYVKPEENEEASGLSETIKEIVGQGFAIAFAGSILFGAVYSNMTDAYAEIEGIELTEVEKDEIIVELEDTFMSITPEEEKAWVQKELPEKTKAAYQEVVNTSAEGAFSTTMWVLNIFVVVCLILSLMLPGIKLESDAL